jgi:hypothetical protein
VSKKVILNVEFEFYPAENEYTQNLETEKLSKYVKDLLDTEFLGLQNNNGLWWNFESVSVVEESNE